MSGEGALRVGGRWTPVGYLAVHASSSIALAVLETLVHAPSQVIPSHRAIGIDVPESIPMTTFATDDLPSDWREVPAPPSLRELGRAWLQAAETAVMRVPSAIVPPEWNYVLNPLHEAFGRMAVLAPAPFEIDVRLFGRSGRPAR